MLPFYIPKTPKTPNNSLFIPPKCSTLNSLITPIQHNIDNFNPLLPDVPFLYPWKQQKTYGILMFQRGKKIEHRAVMG